MLSLVSVEYDNNFWLNYVQTADDARTNDPTTSLFYKLFLVLTFSMNKKNFC